MPPGIKMRILGPEGMTGGALLQVLQFARVHQTLRVTPAMEAGLSDHVWSIEEIVALLG